MRNSHPVLRSIGSRVFAALLLLGLTAACGGEPSSSPDEEDLAEVAEDLEPVEPAADLTEVAKEAVTEAAPQPAAQPHLGMDVPEFLEAWNRAVSEVGSPPQLRLPQDLETDEGEVQDVVEYNFTDYAGIIVAVRKKDGLVRSAVIIAQPQGDDQARTVLHAWSVLINTTHPEFTLEDRFAVFQDLGIGKVGEVDEHEGSAVRGEVRYLFRFSDVAGYMFIADSVRDE